MSLTLTLAAALASLVAWAVLAFAMSVSAPSVHLLLGLGATLLVRWWALRA